MPNHAGDSHPCRGCPPGPIVVTALPIRIGRDGVARDGVPGHTLRVEGVGARDRDDRLDKVAIPNGPLERLHTTQGASGDGSKPRDTKLINQRALGPNHVGDGEYGKVRPVGPTGGGVC